jgi:hypothetical protein
MTPEIIPLIAECESAGIRLSIAGGKLVVEAPVGVVKPELLERLRRHKAELVEALSSYRPAPVAERSLFDDLATPPVAQPVEATAPAATIAPAVAAPVEPTPRLAPAEAAPVTAPAADAPAAELPPGWPSDVAPPPWWGEFTAALDTIWLLSARRSDCPQCGFGVAVEWAGVEYPAQWACPRCGRATEAVNQ